MLNFLNGLNHFRLGIADPDQIIELLIDGNINVHVQCSAYDRARAPLVVHGRDPSPLQ